MEALFNYIKKNWLGVGLSVLISLTFHSWIALIVCLFLSHLLFGKRSW